jgi:hypothetical protein
LGDPAKLMDYCFMQKINRTRVNIGLLSTMLILAYGCATTPVAPPSAPPVTAAVSPPPPQKRAGELALAEGVDLYNQGNYAGAIKKLQESAEIWTEVTTIRVEALKHMAFSACLNKQRTPCRQYFDRLLELEPTFELTPAETGQPDWTPIFKQAKQAASNPARRPATLSR